MTSDINTTDDGELQQSKSLSSNLFHIFLYWKFAAKAGLVPGFLRERIGESGVTRRVRRAYSALDSVTGSIMRRHPAARVCLFGYLVRNCK